MTFSHIDLQQLSGELIALRRDLHRYPESGWTEFRTTAVIVEELEKLGLSVRFGRGIHVPEKMYGMPRPEALEACFERARGETARHDLIEKMKGGFTGCVTEIQGALPGPTVGIRVDIDCNDVDEGDRPEHKPVRGGFRSIHPNLMHACGHDAHAAIGIGVARILCAMRGQLPGKVVLLFQPGEEGVRGAASMAAAGLVDGCDYLFGAHVGMIDWKVGGVAAGVHGFLSSTKLDVRFEGVPAHAGASPEEGRNALAAAAAATTNLLAISRHHAGASRINIGTFHAGTGRNVIPAEAELCLETRGATTEINEYMEIAVDRVVRGAAQMYGCTVETRFMGSSSAAVCDRPLVEKTARILSGLDAVTEVLEDLNFNGGDDVTTLMRRVQEKGGQATELVLGMPLKAPHHNGYFDIDEAVIPFGAQCLAALALNVGKE